MGRLHVEQLLNFEEVQSGLQQNLVSNKARKGMTGARVCGRKRRRSSAWELFAPSNQKISAQNAKHEVLAKVQERRVTTAPVPAGKYGSGRAFTAGGAFNWQSSHIFRSGRLEMVQVFQPVTQDGTAQRKKYERIDAGDASLAQAEQDRRKPERIPLFQWQVAER